MPRFFKLKVILGGATNSGKTSFINGNIVDDTPIGVSFEPIEFFSNDQDSFKFIIWDLKDRERFSFLYPLFCRGACAGLICFDLTDYESFLAIEKWVNLFRESSSDITIFLIGTKSDLGSRAVSEEEINSAINQYNLKKVFFTNIYDQQDYLKEVFFHIVKNIEPDYEIKSFSRFPQDDAEFNYFKNLFRFCPVCNRSLHEKDLRVIYFSNDEVTTKTKEQLLNLITYNLDFQKHIPKLTFGIPCCNCYKKFFLS